MERGVLLVHGGREHVTRWVRRGTLPVHVVPGGPHSPWTVLAPAGPSLATGPYDDGPAMLAARPLHRALRPAIGLWVDGDRAVVTCRARGVRDEARWVGWAPGVGPDPVDGFPLARPVDLARAAGYGADEGAPGAVRAVLADPGGTADEMVTDLGVLLGLPHVELVRGGAADAEGSELVLPNERAVQRFERLVADEQRLDTEVEEGL